MKVFNIIEIFDNGEFITIVTETGSTIHLPMEGVHSITVQPIEDPSDNYTITVNIDLYQN